MSAHDLARDTWPEPVKGLAGRLRVDLEDLKPGMRLAVHLELRNCGFMPVAVSNRPQFKVDLGDLSGAPVAVLGLPSSGPIPGPTWGVIPPNAYLGFRADMQNVGLPTREHGMVLLAIGGKTWGLGTGTYVLEMTLSCRTRDDGPPNQWIGELKLPPVEIVLTADMLAPS